MYTCVNTFNKGESEPDVLLFVEIEGGMSA